MSANPLRVAIDGAIASVTLARPERLNALSPQLMQALVDAGTALARGVVNRVVAHDAVQVLAAPADPQCRDAMRRALAAWRS